MILLSNASGDEIDVSLRLAHRDPGLYTSQDVEVLVSTAVDGLGAERQRQEEIGLLDASYGRHYFAIQQEVRTKHAEDRERLAAEAYTAADNLRICTKGNSPECVSQKGHLRPFRYIVSRKERSPQLRLGAEEGENAGRGLNHLNSLRLAEARHTCVVADR